MQDNWQMATINCFTSQLLVSGASQRASASGKEDLAGVETAKSAGVSAQGWAVL